VTSKEGRDEIQPAWIEKGNPPSCSSQPLQFAADLPGPARQFAIGQRLGLTLSVFQKPIRCLLRLNLTAIFQKIRERFPGSTPYRGY
jgi:hypothetical protein